MNPVLTLPKNISGRDIIVADVHGQYHLLKQALSRIEFNPSSDRLIINGDLVDRGLNSHMAVDWVSKPYCFATIGNHDAQHILRDSLFTQSLMCSPADTWHASLSKKDYDNYVSVMRRNLYPAIEIASDKGNIGIIHAEVPEDHNWSETVEKINRKDYDFFHECMWNRNYAKEAIKGDYSEEYERTCMIEDAYVVYHGHTPSSKFNYSPYRIANRYFIDTGAYKANKADKYPSAGITLFNALHPNTPIYTTGNRELNVIDQKQALHYLKQ